ncbi:MAG: TraX family protein [Candidatus Absconditabacterales bacterium]
MSRATLERPNIYDYLKVIAIITMIIDHMGYFLYPEELWYRTIGRIAFPLFFLLIGRNKSSKIAVSLIIAAVLVQGTLRFFSATQGYDFRQLNILPAAIITKLVLQYIPILTKHIAQFIGLDRTMIPSSIPQETVSVIGRSIVMIACLLLVPYTHTRVDYGSVVLSTAIAGKLLRDYHEQWRLLLLPIALCFGGWIIINQAFPLDTYQWVLVYTARICSIVAVLYMSKHNTAIRIYGIWNKLILWCSDYAVRIYILHFLGLLRIAFLTKQ